MWNGIDLRKDKMAAQRLKEAAEKAKIELSSAMSSQINLPFITADATGPKHLDMTLTRAKFNELTADLVDRTMTPVRKALQDAGLRASDLKKVLMVGGSTRIPAVYDAVKKELNCEPFKGILLIKIKMKAYEESFYLRNDSVPGNDNQG